MKENKTNICVFLCNPTESRKIQLVQILHKLPITGKRINTNSTA